MKSIKEKQLLTISGISRLELEDEQLFRIAFPKDSIQYARSWLYTLRTSHGEDGKRGYKFVTPDIIVVIGYRNNVMYVTPILDKTHGIILQKLCQAIFETTQCRVLLKKFHQESYEQFHVPQTQLDSRHLLEDDSCPETVLQLNKIFISPQGEINPNARKFIKKVKKIEQSAIQFDVIEDITKFSKTKVKHFLAADKEKYASYLPIIDYLYAHQKDLRYKIMLFIYKKKLHGIFIGEVFSLTEMGFYCGVTSKDTPGMTEWMDSYYFRKMFFDGIQTVYLGGSEREGIAHYVNKLFPYNPPYSVQAVMYDHMLKKDEFSLNIRPINEDDFLPLAEIYCKAYNSVEELGEHWTKEIAHKFISSFYKRQPDLFFLAEYNVKIVGAIVAGVQPWWDGNHLFGGEIFVDPQYKNTDIEKRLVKHLLTSAQSKYHAVAWDAIAPNTGNHAWRSFQKYGFTQVPSWKIISGDIYTILKRLQ
ncbi:MAG: GNAT family N-acetyltransferase [Candidatus Levyibacteriota bacterium]